MQDYVVNVGCVFIPVKIKHYVVRPIYLHPQVHMRSKVTVNRLILKWTWLMVGVFLDLRIDSNKVCSLCSTLLTAHLWEARRWPATLFPRKLYGAIPILPRDRMQQQYRHVPLLGGCESVLLASTRSESNAVREAARLHNEGSRWSGAESCQQVSCLHESSGLVPLNWLEIITFSNYPDKCSQWFPPSTITHSDTHTLCPETVRDRRR